MAYSTPGVYIEEIEMGARPIEGVSTSTVGFVGVAEKTVEKPKPIFISSWSNFESSFGGYTATAQYLAPAVYAFFANGGKRCYVVGVEKETDIIGSDINGTRTGLQSLKEIDDVSIVVVPGMSDKTTQDAMIAHCEDMGDRFCILDSKEGDGLDEIIAQKNGLMSSDKGVGALYYPWIRMSASKTLWEKRFIPPSGAVAGVYARSDSQRGVHKAPANEVLRGVVELERAITNNDQGPLNDENINCIRAFKGRGIRIWGARTIAPKGSSWKYINVRRLFLYIEESIDESTQWVVFEPNNEQLWARVTQTINNFLLGVWKSGALMGTNPKEAFFVKCDRTTMTEGDINNGRLIAIIGIAPTKPAEFVIFQITQWTANSDN